MNEFVRKMNTSFINEETIEIRHAINQDVNVIVNILLDVFKDKFSHMFDNDLDKGRLKIEKFYEELCSEELDDYFVTVQEDKILGVIHFTHKESIENSDTSSILQIFNTLGIFKGLRATMALAMLDSKKFNKKSCYIDFMGVLPDAQGKGIETVLINKAEEFARSKNYPLLSLNVIGKNNGITKQYEELGFKMIKYDSGFLSSKLFGISDYYYLEKTL